MIAHSESRFHAARKIVSPSKGRGRRSARLPILAKFCAWLLLSCCLGSRCIAQMNATLQGTDSGGVVIGNVVEGQFYTCYASGCILYLTASDGTHYSDPDGTLYLGGCGGPIISTPGIGGGNPDSDGYALSLVGNVNGAWIQLGDNVSFIAPASGPLTLIYNDSYYGDNSGSFDVSFTSGIQVFGNIYCTCDGSPVANALVELESPSWGSFSTDSLDDGSYVLPDVPPGQYEVTVLQDNYYTTNFTVTIPSDASDSEVEMDYDIAPNGRDATERINLLSGSVTIGGDRPNCLITGMCLSFHPGVSLESQSPTIPTLKTAACFLGYDHFNWFQAILSGPACWVSHLSLNGAVPFWDPQPGIALLDKPGTTVISYGDSLPFYWNENNNFEDPYDLSNPANTTDTALIFRDGPISRCTSVVDPIMSFTTSLVGIRADGSWDQLSEAGIVNWTANVSDLGGGVLGFGDGASLWEPTNATGGIVSSVRYTEPLGMPPAAIVAALAAGGSFPVTVQPAAQSLASGANLMLSVFPTNSSTPLGYQWRLNRANVPGATNVTLQLFDVATNAAGSYDVLITGTNGSIASLYAVVSVDSPLNSTNVYGFSQLHFDPGLGEFTNTDGIGPRSALILSGNTLFGTTPQGGSANNGVVFKVNTDGTGFMTLHSFSAGSGLFPNIVNDDGAGPTSALALVGNVLFGVTESGGSSGNGTVFRLNTDGSSYTNLHSFTVGSGTPSTNSDGTGPEAGLTVSGATLFGTTSAGGLFGFGAVFAINTDGSGFTNLHSFHGGDGAFPSGVMAASSGTLYGTTYEGGRFDHGTVFDINTDGSGFADLYSLGGGDGSGPQAGLVLSRGILYGTTSAGGEFGNGAIFALNSDGSGFTKLHDFSGGDGAFPIGDLIISGNTLYGTASGGGRANDGTVFAVDINGVDFTTLHNFTGSGGEGDYPAAGLVLSGNTIYGTVESGGAANYGAVYNVSLSATNSPRLDITTSGSNIVIAWPLDATGYTLQSSTNLSFSSAWQAVSFAPQVVNGQQTVTIPVSGSQVFYRLVQ